MGIREVPLDDDEPSSPAWAYMADNQESSLLAGNVQRCGHVVAQLCRVPPIPDRRAYGPNEKHSRVSPALQVALVRRDHRLPGTVHEKCGGNVLCVELPLYSPRGLQAATIQKVDQRLLLASPGRLHYEGEAYTRDSEDG